MISQISVIGAGTMGTGIAQVAASNGHMVNVFDSFTGSLENSKKNLYSTLNKLAQKGKITSQNVEKIVSNISWTNEINDISNSNLVFEAVIENLEVKQKLFSQLEGLVSDKCIFSTNTSSLSVSEIGSVFKNKTRFMGIHFFNPVSLMKLVEVVPISQTDLSLVDKTKLLLLNWTKIVVLAKDTPGFIVNRIARPFYGEALKIYEEGLATFDTIDWAMKEFGGFRMGPFELMDYIGNDVNYSATMAVFKGTNNDPHYQPSETQKVLVEKGLLGRKSGRGFYDYSNLESNRKIDKNQKIGKMIFNRILSMLINEAANAVENSIGSREDIDIAMTKGVNYPKGLLKWGDEIGIEFVRNELSRLYSKTQNERYKHSQLLDKLILENSSFYS